MSKDLDRYKKQFAALSKTAAKAQLDFSKHCTNREHHKGILLEAAKQMGRDVQDAKDEGMSGKVAPDFIKHKGVANTMKTALVAIKASVKEEANMNAILKTAEGAIKDLKSLYDEVTEEVTARDKKANRKLLPISSSSLAEMKKLPAKIKSTYVDLDSETVSLQKMEKWSAARQKKDFENWTDAEIARTKSDRKERDTDETDAQGFDMRIVNKKVSETKKLVTLAKAQCDAALSAYKGGKPADGEKPLATAQQAHAALKKIHEPYARRLKKMNAHDRKGLGFTKDGKTLLASVELMEKSIAAVGTMVKKTARSATISG